MPPKSAKHTTDPGHSPVRIYVLWHPDYDLPEEIAEGEDGHAAKTLTTSAGRGLRLARRIFHWFRMENMEGIPVYFRSASAPGSNLPPLVPDDPGVRNYLVALIDANMVACPEWRAYLADLVVNQNDGAHLSQAKQGEYRILPVALEPVAYNMPERIRRLNFIRHVPGNQKSDDLVLLSKLTEVICRDLRQWSRNEDGNQSNVARENSIPDKIRIFLSHAKADDTDEAVAIKEYIQRETQCEAFFDETDIASGYDFKNILENAISKDSAGLIVLQGDNYADRPWCRKEIRDFLEPHLEPWSAGRNPRQYGIAPVVVVQTMKGGQIARTIPELGYSPCVRWQPSRPDAARFVVTTLLREICFGLFNRVLARRVALRQKNIKGKVIYLNRSPDPVMINRILAHQSGKATAANKPGPHTFVHPGYGLSKLEHEGLTTAFPGHHFQPFLDASTGGMTNLPDLRDKIIALSAGNPGDILSRGLWEEHMQELLVRLLQPILRAQASLVFGGSMPESFRPAEPWEKDLNFTGALLQLLLSERDSTGLRGTDAEIPRIYVPTPTHRRSTITPRIIAHWSDVCSFVRVPAKVAGLIDSELDIHPPAPPTPEKLNSLKDQARIDLEEAYRQSLKEYKLKQCVLAARSYSAMRRKICDSSDLLTCELPDAPGNGRRTKRIETNAHIFIGGKLTGFTGIMPGIFEEALCAFDAGKPVFLIAEYGGAAALLARWLVKPPKQRPPELTPEFYVNPPDGTPWKEYGELADALTEANHKNTNIVTPNAAFDRLWKYIDTARKPGALPQILNNGLDRKDNLKLLKANSSVQICEFLWKGLGG